MNLQLIYARSNIVLKIKIEIRYMTNVVRQEHTITSFIDFTSISTLTTSTRISDVNDIVTMFVNDSLNSVTVMSKIRQAWYSDRNTHDNSVFKFSDRPF